VILQGFIFLLKLNLVDKDSFNFFEMGKGLLQAVPDRGGGVAKVVHNHVHEELKLMQLLLHDCHVILLVFGHLLDVVNLLRNILAYG
jgi:hypothetical protein